MTCRATTSSTTCAGGSPTGAPLTYDNEGRLIQWQSAPGNQNGTTIDTFAYDGSGTRVEQSASTILTTS